jgi:putative DNA primase/helicase
VSAAEPRLLRFASHRDAALYYAGRGWPVFPATEINSRGLCNCEDGAACASPAKHPRTTHGLNDATTDAETIRRWWAKWPTANVGIRTGEMSGLVVLDIDVKKHNGRDTLAALEREHGTLPATLTARTGGGGEHRAFRHPGGKVKSTAGDIGPGLDIRADGGYIIVEPSRHVSGKTYEWVDLDAPIAVAPQWLLALNDAGRSKAPDDEADAEKGWDQGERNTRMTSVAGRLRRIGLNEHDIFDELRKVNKRRCHPPLDDDELRRIAVNVSHYEADERYPLTHWGNARRIVDLYGTRIRHTAALGWIDYRDEKRWQAEADGSVARLAKAIVQDMRVEAAVREGKAAAKLWAHAKVSQQNGYVNGTLESLKTEEEIEVLSSDLDPDPWLFNCDNGTFDARTGELRPHRRDDLITKLSPASFDPDARSALWEEFLTLAMGGDTEMIRFLQLISGSFLTPSTRDELLYLLFGRTWTGKSTFVEALLAMLGDYALVTQPGTFQKKYGQGGAAREDLARLRGARLLVSSEIGSRSLDEELIKQIVGGDMIAARNLYKATFQFRPQCKIVFTSNDNPTVRGDDDALWRRLTRIPFDFTFPEKMRDPAVKARLQDPAENGTGILAWMFKGAQQWSRPGFKLVIPERVLQSTAEYRGEMDRLSGFFEAKGYEFAPRDPAAWGSWAGMWEQYIDHTKRNNQKPVSESQFRDYLRRQGCTPQKNNRHIRGWQGVKLSDQVLS